MEIVFDGKKSLTKYLELINSAKKSIWVCIYKVRFDNVSNKIWRALDKQYTKGIDVRVWYDLSGSIKSLHRLLTIPYAYAYIPRINRLLTRNHAKIILVDDKKAVISGRNWSEEYFLKWHDASVFISDKKGIFAVKDFIDRVEQRVTKPITQWSDYCITDPLTRTKNVYHFVLEHIVKSKKEITILSPYFIIDEACEALLLAAAERGVKIIIIVPDKPEHRLATTFNRINFQRINHDNVTVMKSKGMFHTKAIIFDDKALVGSANFDNRSFKYNVEFSVVVGNKYLEQVRKHAKEVAYKSVKYNWVQRAYDQVLFAFTRHLNEIL